MNQVHNCAICHSEFLSPVWNKSVCSEACGKVKKILDKRRWHLLNKDKENRRSRDRVSIYSKEQRCSIASRYRIKCGNRVLSSVSCFVCGSEFLRRCHNNKYCSANCKKESTRKLASLNSRRLYRCSPSHKLSALIRNRLNKALLRKSSSSIALIGATISQLIIYLESKFLPGMSWDNHGIWHIDHIKPFSSFDLSDNEQVLKACHYTNLQPLWARDNLSKGSKY